MLRPCRMKEKERVCPRRQGGPAGRETCLSLSNIRQVLETDIQKHPGSGARLDIRIVVVESVLKYQPTGNRNLPTITIEWINPLHNVERIPYLDQTAQNQEYVHSCIKLMCEQNHRRPGRTRSISLQTNARRLIQSLRVTSCILVCP